MGRIQTFLTGYPHATDERVREWCLAHVDDVALVVPGNNPTALARLVVDELAKRANTTTAA